MMMENDKKISALAEKVLREIRRDILVKLRFFDAATGALLMSEKPGSGRIAMSGATVYYDPRTVLETYKSRPGMMERIYLHILLHLIFSHSFNYDKLDNISWDLACDIATENVILSLGLPNMIFDEDDILKRKLKVLREDAGGLTAEMIYRYFKYNPPTKGEINEYRELTYRDDHSLWVANKEIQLDLKDFKKISEKIRTEIRSFAKDKSGSDELAGNLDESVKDKYDYGEILRHFTVMGENITVNEDEFDYVYYTYGLNVYGNLPLIEPLEYKEEKKVREFVIALDTSASCRGDIVRNFLKKTYGILKSSENFFKKINVHIVQCDSDIQNDTKITNDNEFNDFITRGKLVGFGGTDFRPVFEHVEMLKEKGEFESLKGLIYFTDGYGIYPDRMPDYDVIFAFLNEDVNRGPVPPWSLKVILDEEGLEEDVRADEEAKAAEEANEAIDPAGGML